MGEPGALEDGESETHATYTAFHYLGLGASHDEMQEREGEGELGCRRGEKAFGRHVINLKKERGGRERTEGDERDKG